MTHPRVGMYGACDGTGFPFIENGALVQSRIDAAAKYDDLILDLAAVEAFPQIKTALRAAGPVRLHAYQVMATWNNPNGPKLWQDIWKMVNATGGLLTTMPAGCPNINVAMRATMDGLASLILQYAAGWDGIFVDVLIPQWQSGAGFDWRGMGFVSEQAFLDAWKANALDFVQKLRAA